MVLCNPLKTVKTNEGKILLIHPGIYDTDSYYQIMWDKLQSPESVSIHF